MSALLGELWNPKTVLLIDLDLEVQDQDPISSGTRISEHQEIGVYRTNEDQAKRLGTLMGSMTRKGLHLELEDLI